MSMTYREYWRAFQRRIGRHFCFDLNDDPNRTILLSGSGRSGTTWLTDLINYRNEYRAMFEPLHQRHVAMVRHFVYPHYLREDADEPEYTVPLDAILRGRIRGRRWTDSQNRKVFATRRLIKDIRGNLMLGWIAEHYPGIKLIHILRHPCAVVNSRMKVRWTTDLQPLLDQPALMEDHLEPFGDLLSSVDPDSFAGHLLLWCCENYVPLRQFAGTQRLFVIFYENFVLDPHVAIRDTFAYLGKPVRPAVFRCLDLPSNQSRPYSAIKAGGDLLNSWRKDVAPDQLRAAEEILGRFGLDGLYDAKSVPRFANGFAALSVLQSPAR